MWQLKSKFWIYGGSCMNSNGEISCGHVWVKSFSLIFYLWFVVVVVALNVFIDRTAHALHTFHFQTFVLAMLSILFFAPSVFRAPQLCLFSNLLSFGRKCVNCSIPTHIWASELHSILPSIRQWGENEFIYDGEKKKNEWSWAINH